MDYTGKMRILVVALLVVVSGLLMKVSAQVVNGCTLQPEQWQLLMLNKDEGTHVLEFNYSSCKLDLSEYAFLEIEIENGSQVPLIADISYIGPESWKSNAGRQVIPGNTTEVTKLILFREALDVTSPWHAEFSEVRALPGNYVIHWSSFDLSQIKKVKVELKWKGLGTSTALVKVKTPTGSGEYTFPEVDFNSLPRPLVDEMGQLKIEDWDRKLTEIDELVELGKADTASFISATFGEEYSKYGGFKNAPLQYATGYFRTAKVNDKWWLVDPEGYLFWSQGVTGVGKGVSTATPGRQTLFPDFADEKSGELWPMLEEQTQNNGINFYLMNVIRKYGSDWESLHAGVAEGRLKTWGLNSYGAWSEIPDVITHPYTLIIHPTKTVLGGIDKIVDPFSSGFLSSLKSYLESLSSKSSDPYLLGVFVNNELHFNNTNSIPNEVLKLNNSKPARKAMEDFLEDKYSSIESLNSAWNSSFAAFINVNGESSDSYTSVFRQDMDAYLDYFADTYYRVVAEEVERVFPNHLYLGSRLHGSVINNVIVSAAASRHCDVVSFNYYSYGFDKLNIKLEEDKPMIIGEFHFGTGSHGVWGVGLKYASGMDNQAELYKLYSTEALNHPNIVGTHWFQWADQMVTGRKDGENFRIGLVNVTDQPYPEMVDAIQEIAATKYQERLGIGTAQETRRDEMPGAAVNVYPNPNNGCFYIETEMDVPARMSLITLKGEQIYSGNISKGEPVMLPGAVKGVYILRTELTSTVDVQRILVL